MNIRDGAASIAAPLPWRLGALLGETRAEPRSHPIDRAETAALEALRNGDDSAYTYLVQKYMRKALSIAWGVLRDSAEAEDITQEALIKAHQKIGSIKSNQAFSTWLFRIVTNLALDRLRSRRRHPTEELTAEFPSAVRSDAVSSESMAERIDRAIESLPGMQRLVARLYLVEEFSHAEIAIMLKLNEGTVRSNLSHARRKLQERLHDLHEETR